MKPILVLVLSTVLFLGACQSHSKKENIFKEPTLPAMLNSEVIMKKRTFGVYRDLGTKQEVLETKTIRHGIGSPYGWRLHVDSIRDFVKVREELTLPAAGQWNTEGSTVVSEDKRVGITTVVLPIYKGTVENYWTVADGDPKGDYRIRVWIDDVEAAEFRFRVE